MCSIQLIEKEVSVSSQPGCELWVLLKVVCGCEKGDLHSKDGELEFLAGMDSRNEQAKLI